MGKGLRSVRGGEMRRGWPWLFVAGPQLTNGNVAYGRWFDHPSCREPSGSPSENNGVRSRNSREVHNLIVVAAGKRLGDPMVPDPSEFALRRPSWSMLFPSGRSSDYDRFVTRL